MASGTGPITLRGSQRQLPASIALRKPNICSQTAAAPVWHAVWRLHPNALCWHMPPSCSLPSPSRKRCHVRAHALHAVQAGDIFQLVLSQRFERRTFADPFEIFR
jgi:hypothetical protein